MLFTLANIWSTYIGCLIGLGIVSIFDKNLRGKRFFDIGLYMGCVPFAMSVKIWGMV